MNTALGPDGLASLGETLGRCRKLELLSCKGSPVENAEYYREYLVFKCKKLRSLDFDRIKEKVLSPQHSLVLIDALLTAATKYIGPRESSIPLRLPRRHSHSSRPHFRRCRYLFHVRHFERQFLCERFGGQYVRTGDERRGRH